MSEQVIEIQTQEGLVSISASVYGYFAIHPSVNWPGGDYAVTHVPTGRLVAGELSRRQALRLVRKVKALGLNWDFTDHRRSLGYGPVVKPLIAEIKAAGPR